MLRIQDHKQQHRHFSAIIREPQALLGRCKSSLAHERRRLTSRQHGLDSNSSYYYGRPDIRLAPVSRKMSTDEFPVILFPPGLYSRPIEIDRAIESDTIAEHLILEAVAIEHGCLPDPYFTTVGQYKIVGKIQPKWRRKEREEASFSTRNERWLVTRGPLPNNVQAVVSLGASPPQRSRTLVAPVHQARQSSKEKANDATRNKTKAEEREKAVPAYFEKLSERYDRTKSSPDKTKPPSSKPQKTY